MRTLQNRAIFGSLSSIASILLVVLFILPFLFSSCTKEVIVVQEVEKPNDWTRLEIFNDPYYSFKQFPEHLLIQTPISYLNIDSELTASRCTKSSFGTDSYREPISERWLINQNSYFLNACPSAYSLCDVTTQELRLGDLREIVDLEIEDPALWEPTKSFSRMLISGDQVFLPYRRTGETNLQIAILTITESSGSALAEVTNVTTTEVEGVSNYDYPFRHWAVEDGFLFTLFGPSSKAGLYKITSFGEVIKVSPAIITSTFTYQGSLYGADNDKIFSSDDNGKTWVPVFEFLNNNHAFTDFVEVDNQLFGLYLDKCVRCEVSPESFSCEPLNTDELNSQEITHLTKFANQAVMMTSAGIYTRDWEQFLLVE